MKRSIEGLLYLHNNLVALKAVGPRFLQAGICKNVSDEENTKYESRIGHDDNLFELTTDVTLNSKEKWCSGDCLFPVGCPGFDSPAEAYDVFYDMWEGEYGANRRKFLYALIINLEHKIAEISDDHILKGVK
jgi:hypothetical protein